MNVYLDIDGVLLDNEGRLAIGAIEFIKYAVEHLNRASPEDLRPWLERFKPVTWSLKKTEAIDFTKPFLWFDDDCFTGEKIDLYEHSATNSWIEINLRSVPDQMVKELVTLQAFTKEHV